MMPDMDGWETLEQLKAIDPAVTVVLSSGYADRGGRRSNLSGEHPMLFLQKPYVEADLCAVLEQAIRLRAERRAPG
jgi:CheY-like chemotaxis protein